MVSDHLGSYCGGPRPLRRCAVEKPGRHAPRCRAFRRDAVAGYVAETWHEGQRWMVNPGSGCELARIRERSPRFPRCLGPPDRAFWEAAGFYGTLTDKTAKFNYRVKAEDCYGGWLNAEQCREKWLSVDYSGPGDVVNRLPTCWSDRHRARVMGAGGRARSPATPGRC